MKASGPVYGKKGGELNYNFKNPRKQNKTKLKSQMRKKRLSHITMDFWEEIRVFVPILLYTKHFTASMAVL